MTKFKKQKNIKKQNYKKLGFVVYLACPPKPSDLYTEAIA